MTIKKTGIAASAVLALSAVFSTAAMARPVDLSACTKDGNTAILHTDIEGKVKGGPALEDVMTAVWAKTAASLTTAQFSDGEWVPVFEQNLEEALQGTEPDPSVQAKLEIKGGELAPGCKTPAAPTTPAP